jgi:hypothetical protein
VGRIRTISMNVFAKFKAENPDFDMDFDAFVKELSTDEVVISRRLPLSRNSVLTRPVWSSKSLDCSKP